MQLLLDVQHTGDVAVVNCAGRIVRGDATCALKEAVLSQRDSRVIVLDLSEVEMIDGGGLGALVFLRRWTKDKGVQLKLVNPSNLIRELLERTRLTQIFDISSVDDALTILGCERQVRTEFHYATAS
ncbi:MAG TPA: STAS domain-containing protein [Terriglobales bacterium]|nr:STAS domain-containing protein [Terriglobales bacterium]